MTFKTFNLNYWFAIAGNFKHAEREKEKTECQKKKKSFKLWLECYIQNIWFYNFSRCIDFN